MERWRVTPQSLRTTTKIYLSITALIWITAIVCIATSIWSISYTRPASSKKDASRTFISGEIPVHAPKGLISLAPLLLVISATLVGGFTNHLRSITLRWGLWREERLAFNSNLAAFQLASRVSLNGWPTNLVYVLCLVLSLTASSQTFIGFSEMGGSRTFVVVNGIALATLGVSVMGQAILAAWSIVRIEKKALPWGVDPMTTAVTCLHEGLIRRKDRCMIAAGYSGRPREFCKPAGRQTSAAKARRMVRRIPIVLWVINLTLLALGFSVRFLTKLFSDNYSETSASMGLKILHDMQPMLLRSSFTTSPAILPSLRALFAVAALQIALTLALESADMLFKMNHDESAWRRAYTVSGRNKNAARESSSWQALMERSRQYAHRHWEDPVSFTFKVISHWLFGLGIQAHGTRSIYKEGNVVNVDFSRVDVVLNYIPIFLLAFVTFILALVSTVLSQRKPHGPQPSVWGHIQTMANLMDHESSFDSQQPIYWGDKGRDEYGIRYAGTSPRSEDVREIRTDCIYSNRDLASAPSFRFEVHLRKLDRALSKAYSNPRNSGTIDVALGDGAWV